MTPQYFNVLTVLAMHPGQFILDVDLEKMPKRLRWLKGRGGLGEKRLTKKRMKNPLVAAVKGLDIPQTELDSLISCPRGVPKYALMVPDNSVKVIEFDASGL